MYLPNSTWLHLASRGAIKRTQAGRYLYTRVLKRFSFYRPEVNLKEVSVRILLVSFKTLHADNKRKIVKTMATDHNS